VVEKCWEIHVLNDLGAEVYIFLGLMVLLKLIVAGDSSGKRSLPTHKSSEGMSVNSQRKISS
jgi:hypothetical protein